MKNFFISKSRRVRSTPFTSRIEEQGVKSYTVYNHMLLPAVFSSVEDSYHHLKEHVQIWDVAGERQVENAKIGMTHVIGLGSACGIHILEKV